MAAVAPSSYTFKAIEIGEGIDPGRLQTVHLRINEVAKVSFYHPTADSSIFRIHICYKNDVHRTFEWVTSQIGIAAPIFVMAHASAVPVNSCASLEDAARAFVRVVLPESDG
jgi:hypothetical protein